MNTHKLLVSVLILTCVILSACTPATTAIPIVSTAVPPTEAPDEFALAGDPIPDNLLDVDYFLVDGKPPVVIRLRAHDDPQCIRLEAVGNCFTILRVDNPADPGARGPAAIVNGQVALFFQSVPFGPDDVGSIEYFEPQEDGRALVGVKCETRTGAECSADVGSTWRPVAQKITFQSPENEDFRLLLAFTHTPVWKAHVGINSVNIVYGNAWGSGIALVNGALVHDPATAVSDQAASANKSDFVPWPNDFFAYITSLPGVEVIQGPDPVTIGGIQGSQIIIHTPPMHPILWLKDDYTWLGGGSTGVDPEFKRLMILLEVNGERVLLEFDEIPDKFDERYPLVLEIFNSITFGE